MRVYACVCVCACVRVPQVSSGAAHTLALSAVYDSAEGEGDLKAVVPRGGQVWMAGARSVLGVDCPVFTLADGLDDTPCLLASAGCVCERVC